jgi:hypothetical protein
MSLFSVELGFHRYIKLGQQYKTLIFLYWENLFMYVSLFGMLIKISSWLIMGPYLLEINLEIKVVGTVCAV